MIGLTLMEERGWIALDIDGTTTADVHSIPKEVVDVLSRLSKQGWKIFFITGRMFTWALGTVSNLPFPFYFATQNGADILEMPSKRLLSRAYLSPSIIPFLDREYITIDEDFIIYTGFEKGDGCYYRPQNFSEAALPYLELLKSFSPTPWIEKEEFAFASDETFPLIKCFGEHGAMLKLNQKLLKHTDIEVSLIRDPLSENFYLNLITDAGASKGTAIERIRRLKPSNTPLIAAGDDFNDLPMLRQADVKIVMRTAPEELQREADIVAPSAKECGLVPALKEATARLNK